MTKILSTPAEGIFRFPQWPPGESGTQGVVSVNQHGYPEAKIALPKVKEFAYPPKDERIAHPEILVGQLLNSRAVTLINNSLVNFEFSTGKFGLGGQQSAMTYYSGILLFGENSFEDKNAIEVDEITMQIHNLGAWMWRNILLCSYALPSGKAGYDHISVRYDSKNPIFSCKLNDSDEFEIGDKLLGMNYPTPGMDVSEVTVKACHFVRYRNADAMKMDEIIKHIKAILNFFSLGLGHSTYCLQVLLSNPEMRKNGHALSFYMRDMFRETGHNSHMHPEIMPFPFSKTEAKLPDIAARWIKLYREIPDQLDYYFAVEGIKNQHIENRFLGLTRTLENLYPRIAEKQKNAECEKTKKGVIASCPDDFKRWLTKKLERACSPSFADKVRYFINNFSDMTGHSVPNADKIVRHIAVIRHEATHRGVLKNRDGYDVMVLFSDLMNLLVQYALMREIGVPQDSYKEHLAQNAWIFRELQGI